MWSRIFQNLKYEYLCKNEILSEIVLACLFWPYTGCINEIKNAKKSCDTATLSTLNFVFTCIAKNDDF